MSTEDYEDLPRPKRSPLDVVWNVLSIIVILFVVCVASVFLLIYMNPYISLNPFPPPTAPAILALPTSTPTPRSLPPTWTPTPTLEPTATRTRRPTATFVAIIITPSLQTAASATPIASPGGYPYILRSTPLALPSTAVKDVGCNWMGVGGEVTDINGAPKTQLIVILGGTLEGKLVDPTGVQTSLTGVASQYGVAGYEFILANQPIASKQTLWVQLIDQSGAPLSDKIYFDTFADCNKNLIRINFKQVR